jgi:hypothetical protein
MEGLRVVEFLQSIDGRHIEGLDANRFSDFLYSIKPEGAFATAVTSPQISTSRNLPYSVIRFQYFLDNTKAKASSLKWHEHLTKFRHRDDALLQLRADEDLLDFLASSRRPYSLLGEIEQITGEEPTLISRRPLLILPFADRKKILTWEDAHTIYERERPYLPNKPLTKKDYLQLIA